MRSDDLRQRCFCSHSTLNSHYESLVTAPEEELRDIMRSLDLSLDERQLSLERRADDPRAQADKFARLGEAIDASSQGRWREELDRPEVQAFEGIAGQQLEALGYDLATPK
ncbi:hypothetical protein GGP68_003790 [Salinibacter ruber]|uniref:Uncharacterized protein n=1 Tax=Salinibacter ruber TaxID=146919 RepID=A0A9X2Q6C1_9BACT|nr:hypothetical protein [Salinibacter ruber]MCS3712141.1 hypothetical protein [Salinibacter ruber]